jgi:hypothetical protein
MCPILLRKGKSGQRAVKTAGRNGSYFFPGFDGAGAGRRIVSTVVVEGRRSASRTGMNSPVRASRPIF